MCDAGESCAICAEDCSRAEICNNGDDDDCDGLIDGYEFDEYFFEGAIDEVRISSVPRYTATFTPARRLSADSDTVLLLHFDEGSGVATRAETPDAVAGAVNGAVWIPE